MVPTVQRFPAALRWAGIVALILLAGKIAFIVVTPVRQLGMTPWLIDDSFIVMQVARSIASGHGFSFDGLHPTTGVSFLWTYLSAPFHFVGNTNSAVKLTLIASAAFGAIAVLLTFDITRRVTGSSVTAWIAFVLVSLLPVPFFNTMNGMETALFTIWILVAFSVLLREDMAERCPSAWGAWMGLWSGLAILTRADGIFAATALVLVLLWKIAYSQGDRRRRMMRALLGMIIMTAACTAILLTWQWMQTGSLLPNNQFGRRAIALSKHGITTGELSFTRFLHISIWNIFGLESLLSLAVGSFLLAAIALFSVLLSKRAATFGWATTLYLLLFLGMLAGYQWYFPDFHGLRYLHPLLHLLVICIAMLLALLPSSRGRPAAIIFIVLLTIGITWYRYSDFGRRMDWAKGMHLFARSSPAEQSAFWAAIEWVSKHTPEDAVIGVRDHGRMAFFTGRRIQDLAGILDTGVLAAWKNGTIGEYLRSRGVSYLFLPAPDATQKTIYQTIHSQLPLTPVPTAPRQNMTGFILYKVRN